MEQAGALTGNLAAREMGTAVSLISPADALWRMAAFELTPPILRGLEMGPPNFLERVGADAGHGRLVHRPDRCDARSVAPHLQSSGPVVGPSRGRL